MQSIQSLLHSRNGVLRTRDLRRAGAGPRQIRQLLAEGALRRVRIGWYARPDLEGSLRDALRVGGVADCVTAAESYGLQVPRHAGLHVAVSAHASRLRTRTNGFATLPATGQPGVTLHWCEAHSVDAPRLRTGLIPCLLRVIECQPEDWAVAIVDSALSGRRPLLTRRGLSELTACAPGSARHVLDLVDGRAESCIESLTRVRLQRLGIPLQIQVVVASGIRVDILVNRSIVIELDGSEHHAGEEEFERDRVRDAPLNALGYRVLHFSYKQVVDDWPSVESTILLVMRQRPPIVPRLDRSA